MIPIAYRMESPCQGCEMIWFCGHVEPVLCQLLKEFYLKEIMPKKSDLMDNLEAFPSPQVVKEYVESYSLDSCR